MIKVGWPRWAVAVDAHVCGFQHLACGSALPGGMRGKIQYLSRRVVTGPFGPVRIHDPGTRSTDAFTQRYESGRTYIMIVWPISVPSVIRLTEPVPCGLVTEQGCAERISGRL